MGTEGDGALFDFGGGIVMRKFAILLKCFVACGPGAMDDGKSQGGTTLIFHSITQHFTV
jgi:hypothetical protein